MVIDKDVMGVTEKRQAFARAQRLTALHVTASRGKKEISLRINRKDAREAKSRRGNEREKGENR